MEFLSNLSFNKETGAYSSYPYELIYEGQFKDQIPDGLGKIYFDKSNLMYSGQISNAKFHNHGTVYH